MAGASDDGAGCAVVLETLRALAAARAPLRHDVVALLNGAEENIMQASHAFITQHKYAPPCRTDSLKAPQISVALIRFTNTAF